MCWMIYLASDSPLPTSAWDEARRGFHATELSDHDQPVRRQFSKPFVYLMGSYQGCGCGFQYGESEEYHDDPEALAAAVVSRRDLAGYMTEALRHQSELEMYVC